MIEFHSKYLLVSQYYKICAHERSPGRSTTDRQARRAGRHARTYKFNKKITKKNHKKKQKNQQQGKGQSNFTRKRGGYPHQMSHPHQMPHPPPNVTSTQNLPPGFFKCTRASLASIFVLANNFLF